jgi:hypothetical protein
VGAINGTQNFVFASAMASTHFEHQFVHYENPSHPPFWVSFVLGDKSFKSFLLIVLKKFIFKLAIRINPALKKSIKNRSCNPDEKNPNKNS